MPYEDYLELEIQKIGKMLSELLSYILKIKGMEDNSLIYKNADTTMVDNLKLSINDILNSDIRDFQKVESLNLINLELIADLLTKTGNITDIQNQKKHYGKALEILNYIDDKSRTFSAERFSKIQDLTKKIEL